MKNEVSKRAMVELRQANESLLWFQAAKDLFNLHNPTLDIESVAGKRILAGFIVDMKYLKQKYTIEKKTP